MNQPNPFIPQGSVLEHDKRRSRMKLAVFCVLAIGVAGLTAMLIQGCKREQTENPPPADTNQVVIDTNVTAMAASNLTATVPTMPSNPPAMVAPVTPAAPAAATEYTVVKGDTLATIAKANHVTLKALEDANPGVVPTKLKIGQKLNIPAAGATATTEAAPAASGMGGEVYVVKSGDTLTKIAHDHGTTVKAIETANSLTTTKIKVGQKLTIPAKAETTAPAAAEPAPVAPAPSTPPAPAPAPAGTPTGQ